MIYHMLKVLLVLCAAYFLSSCGREPVVQPGPVPTPATLYVAPFSLVTWPFVLFTLGARAQ